MANFGDLYEQNILISGASSGIGQSIAIECSKAGANIFLVGRNESRLKDTMNMLDAGHHAYSVLDLTDNNALENLISTQIVPWGLLNGFVHSAGEEFSAPVQFTKPSHMRKMLEINSVSGFETVRQLMQKKIIDESTGASIIFINSVRSTHGMEGSLAYSVSKGALLSGARVLALELAKKKIRVNSILPSLVATPMTDRYFDSIPEETFQNIVNQHPLGLGLPIDVANACLFLLSSSSRWITGIELVVDGGFSIR